MTIDDKLLKSLREDSVDEAVIQDELQKTPELDTSHHPLAK